MHECSTNFLLGVHSTNAAVSQSLWVIVQLAAATVVSPQQSDCRTPLCLPDNPYCHLLLLLPFDSFVVPFPTWHFYVYCETHTPVPFLYLLLLCSASKHRVRRSLSFLKWNSEWCVSHSDWSAYIWFVSMLLHTYIFNAVSFWREQSCETRNTQIETNCDHGLRGPKITTILCWFIQWQPALIFYWSARSLGLAREVQQTTASHVSKEKLG